MNIGCITFPDAKEPIEKIEEYNKCIHQYWMLLYSLNKMRCYDCGIYKKIDLSYFPTHTR